MGLSFVILSVSHLFSRLFLCIWFFIVLVLGQISLVWIIIKHTGTIRAYEIQRSGCNLTLPIYYRRGFIWCMHDNRYSVLLTTRVRGTITLKPVVLLIWKVKSIKMLMNFFCIKIMAMEAESLRRFRKSYEYCSQIETIRIFSYKIGFLHVSGWFCLPRRTPDVEKLTGVRLGFFCKISSSIILWIFTHGDVLFHSFGEGYVDEDLRQVYNICYILANRKAAWSRVETQANGLATSL